MKKTKVENISNIKLEFFLKQNKEDVRVILGPGESSWCNHGTTTKSMILYERKNLIKSHTQIEVADLPIKLVISTEDKSIYNSIEKQSKPSIDAIDKKIEILNPKELTLLEKATKETEEYKKESKKTYSGKKRGRKKKRGPKSGSKRKKVIDNPPTDI